MRFSLSNEQVTGDGGNSAHLQNEDFSHVEAARFPCVHMFVQVVLDISG
jgi:hypothetical protein